LEQSILTTEIFFNLIKGVRFYFSLNYVRKFEFCAIVPCMNIDLHKVKLFLHQLITE